MADNMITTGVAFEADKRSAKETVKVAKDVRRAISEQEGANKALASSVENVARSYKKTKRASRNTGLDRTANEAKQATDRYEQLTRAVADYEERQRRVKGSGADVFGDVASSSAGLRGVADFAGAGALAAPLEGLEAVGDLGEFLPQLRGQIEGVGNVIRNLDNPVGSVATKAGDAISSVTGLSAGLGTAAGLAGVGVVAAGAVALVNAEMQRQAEVAQQAAEATRLNLEIRQQQRRDEITATELLQQAQSGSVEAYEELVSRQSEASSEMDRISEDIADATQALNNTEEVRGDRLLGGGLPEGIRDFAMGGELSRLDSIIESARGEIEELTPRLAEADSAFQTFNNALRQIPEEQRKALEAQLEASDETSKALQQTANNYEQTASRVEQASEQITKAQEDRARQQQRQAELEALDEEAEQLRREQRRQDHQDRLASIEETGQERIESIRSEISNLPGELSSSLETASNDAQSEIDKLTEDYFDNQIKRTRDFRLQQQRINEDFNRELSRTLADIENQLSDAARDNNVLAFLEAERSGSQRVGRMREDAGVESRRAIEDFRRESAEQRKAFEERKAQINLTLEEEKAAIREKFETERAELQKSLIAEKQAIKERLAEAERGYQQQIQREQQLQSIQQRRQSLQAQYEQQDFQRQIARLREKERVEIEALDAVLARTREIARAAGRTTAGTPGTNANNSRFTDPGSPFITEGFSGSSSSNPGVSINFSPNQTIGDIASKSDVTQANRETVTEIASTVVRIFQNMTFPNS